MLLRSALFAILLSACAAAAVVGDYDSRLPLVFDGGGWSTEVTLVNLSATDANVEFSFATAKGYAEDWGVVFKASAGQPKGSVIQATIKPGATLTLTTDGTPEKLTRGYGRLTVFNSVAVGGSAVLMRRVEGKVVQSVPLALAPESERRSRLPVRIDSAVGVELAFVSETSYTRVDFTFRDVEGLIVLVDYITFDGATQIFVPLRETYPKLENFVGSVEWTVSWPGADIYENQYLTSAAIVTRGGAIEGVRSAMTLTADQTRARRH